MPNDSELSKLQKMLILIVFIFSIAYWSYLAFISQAIIIYDAQGYQDLGRLIYQHGWIEYFKTGPNREPIYPFLVSLAMRIADPLSCSYQTILRIFHLLILILTQALLTYVLVKNRVKKIIMFGILFYFAISPAIVNSALTVYSEIACYPFLIAIPLVSISAWRSIQIGNIKTIMFTSFLLGISFVGITFVKGIYEFIFPFFIVPFFILLFKLVTQQHQRNQRNVLIFVMLTSSIFFLSIGAIKSLNKKYNGIYALTDRGSLALYGSTARRTERLNMRKFFTAITYNFSGEDRCYSLFPRKECDFWGIKYSDEVSSLKFEEITRRFPRGQVNSALVTQIIKNISQNPFQFLLLTSIDWLKMFSWESTRIGFAVYPDWVDKVYDYKPFKDILEPLVGILSFLSFVYLSLLVWRSKHALFAPKDKTSDSLALYLFLLLIIICHVSFYSLFATVTRWALPLAPLYLLLMAFSIDNIMSHKF